MNFLRAICILSIPIILIDSTNCQMISGLPVTQPDFNYQVVILTSSGFCGGAIIAEYYVITAAHCVDGATDSDIVVYAGMLKLSDPNKIIKYVEDVHIHPNYSRLIFGDTDSSGTHNLMQPKNDIAVLALYDAIQFGDKVKKIDLPTENIPDCETCFISGWGITELLDVPDESRWSTMIIETPDNCRAEGVPHRANELCAIDPLRISTPSLGDSGSALRCNEELTGIVSYGKSNAEYPAIFANVYDHLEFINGIIRDV